MSSDRRAIQGQSFNPNQIKQCHLGLSAKLAAAVAAVTMLGAGSARAAFDATSSNFTFTVIPDPQYYAVVQWKTDLYYAGQMNWVVNNQTAKNIGFVFGMGDNVQDGNPYTTVNHQITTTFTGNIIPQSGTPAVNGAPSINSVDPVNFNFEAEWARAANAWGILDNANIPNSTVIGNHDYYHWDQKKDPSEWVKYFPATRDQNKPWFGGFSPVDTSQPSNLQYAGLNTYSYFTAGGYKFLNIALQYNPVQGDLNWAQSIIDANPGIPTVITTHDYQNTTGRDTAGNFIWNNFINKAGNDQIFMVLSGHVNGTHEQVSTNVDGKQVVEILTDYQEYTFNTNNGYSKVYANGGGFLRNLAFNLTAGTITATTYSPYIDSQGDNPFLTTRSGTGANADAFTINFDFASRFGAPPFLGGANFYWDPGQTNSQTGGGTGTWDTSTNNWSNASASNVPWNNATPSNVAFFGGAAGNVSVAASGVSASQLTFNSSGYTLSNGTITLSSNAVLSSSATATTTISSVLAGTSGLTISGGTFVLQGTNTLTGGLTINNGAVVSFSTMANLGATSSTQPITLNGGTLSYTGSATTANTDAGRTYTIGANGGTFDVPNSGAGNGKFVINGTGHLTGSGPITKTGQGWLTLIGNNTSLTGNWTLNGGVLEICNNVAAGTGSITVNNGAEVAINLQVTTPANAIILNTGSTISTDNHTAGGGNYAGPITANGAFNVRLGDFWGTTVDNVTFSGNVSGTGQATLIAPKGTTTSTGTFKLTGDNSHFSGGFVIPFGTVSAAGAGKNSLGTGPITLSGGKLALASTAQSYTNSVSITSDSSIDVSNSLTATLGSLAVGSNKLTLTSADATTSPYSLAFGSTALSGNAAFDIESSAGGGAGNLALGAVSGNGSITKTGAGTLQLAGGQLTGNLAINAGNASISSNMSVGGLSMAASTALDLKTNSLVVNYSSASPAVSIRSLLAQGYNNGTWNGTGIQSSTAAANANSTTALGYAEASDLGLAHGGSFAGQSIANQAVLIKYTYYGDENLDGVVNLDDFSIFIDGFNGLGSGWVYGDFNYDGVVDQKDFAMFVEGYALNGAPLSTLEGMVLSDPSLSASQKSAMLSVVPEPGVLGLVGLLAIGLAPRRRKVRV